MSDRAVVQAIGTFMGVPASRDLADSQAAVLGIPFDCGFHPTRIGSRLGPQSIREHSGLVRRFEPPFRDYDPVARLGLVDCGDVTVRSGYVAEAYENIEAAVSEIVRVGYNPGDDGRRRGGDPAAIACPASVPSRSRYPPHRRAYRHLPR